MTRPLLERGNTKLYIIKIQSANFNMESDASRLSAPQLLSFCVYAIGIKLSSALQTPLVVFVNLRLYQSLKLFITKLYQWLSVHEETGCLANL